jgi:putative transposase
MGSDRAHRKLVKHYHEPGDLHELTFSCYHRMPLMTNDAWREELARSIEEAGHKTCICLAAFVFMPEHVHLLVVPEYPRPAIDEYLALAKQPFSKFVKGVLLETRSSLIDQLMVEERPGKTCFRFWQEGPGYDRNIYSPSCVESCIDYIHQNPVRRGLVKRAVEWRWSSASWYLLDPPRRQFPGLPFIHGLPAGTLDR